MKQDYAGAFHWYKLAADQGLPGAANDLGVLYEDGTGIEKDYQQAARLYRVAAEKGVGGGEFNLAKLYSAGKGVPLDYVASYFWYSRALADGEPLAALGLKEIASIMTPRQKQVAEDLVAGRQELGGETVAMGVK